MCVEPNWCIKNLFHILWLTYVVAKATSLQNGLSINLNVLIWLAPLSNKISGSLLLAKRVHFICHIYLVLFESMRFFNP
jgi:hypothetical protein